MSRKRDKQRGNRKELARQIGVKGSEVPDALLANERVTQPDLKLSLVVQQAKRGWFKGAQPLAVHAVLFVVDAGGARLARLVSARGLIKKTGDVALTIAETRGDDVIRYRRPGHFVVVALLTEGPDDALAHKHAAALADVKTLRVVVDGKTLGPGDSSLSRIDQPRAVTLEHANAAIVDVTDAQFFAASTMGIPAAHRVQEIVELPLITVDGALKATLSVALRL
ncbi:MAG: hypothetical protein Q8O67_03790 [Deltaproteobacteria bacterium]|nr:hypothetical protein [Deltaproteobacteria bacterium]